MRLRIALGENQNLRERLSDGIDWLVRSAIRQRQYALSLPTVIE
jgi:hypothetical protein